VQHVHLEPVPILAAMGQGDASARGRLGRAGVGAGMLSCRMVAVRCCRMIVVPGWRAIAVVGATVAPGTVFTHVTDPATHDQLASTVPGWPAAANTLLLAAPPTPVDPFGLVRFGADVHRLRAALAAEGLPSTLLPPPPGTSATAALAL